VVVVGMEVLLCGIEEVVTTVCRRTGGGLTVPAARVVWGIDTTGILVRQGDFTVEVVVLVVRAIIVAISVEVEAVAVVHPHYPHPDEHHLRSHL